ncbi:MAG TPA: hypothetical protein VNR18_10100, partial [Hyphomicrobiales bacterium]|nr:hypothetical protein [Hyphomicrobiales bacterium]
MLPLYRMKKLPLYQMKKITVRAVLMLAFAGASHVALADNLLEVFELAADNDPTVREARAQYGVAHTSVLEGVAGLLPQVTVNGSSA